MFDLGKCILVTNNDRAAEKWGDKVEQVVLVETYEEVLLKTRDFSTSSGYCIPFKAICFF